MKFHASKDASCTGDHHEAPEVITQTYEPGKCINLGKWALPPYPKQWRNNTGMMNDFVRVRCNQSHIAFEVCNEGCWHCYDTLHVDRSIGNGCDYWEPWDGIDIKFDFSAAVDEICSPDYIMSFSQTSDCTGDFVVYQHLTFLNAWAIDPGQSSCTERGDGTSHKLECTDNPDITMLYEYKSSGCTGTATNTYEVHTGMMKKDLAGECVSWSADTWSNWDTSWAMSGISSRPASGDWVPICLRTSKKDKAQETRDTILACITNASMK